MAGDTAKKTGMPLKSLWIDGRTHKALADLCGSVILACWGCEQEVWWPSLSERHLEKRFGRLRVMFSNSAMTSSDYFRASAIIMRTEDSRNESKNLKIPTESSLRLSSCQFGAIAQQSMQAALKLACLCSGRTTMELQSAFHASRSAADYEAEIMHEHEGEENEGQEMVLLLVSHG